MPSGVYQRRPISTDPAFIPFEPGRRVGHIVNPRTGCWEWQGRKSKKGYGQIHFGSKRSSVRIAHVVYYEREHGLVPDGKQLDHVCRNRGCVNPDPQHLEPVTSEVNNHRGDRSKLTADDVAEIRRRYAAGAVSFLELARDYKVSKSCVRAAVSHHTWKSVAA